MATGKRMEFRRPDGKSAPGYLATPTAGDQAPGVVVIHEWWGLSAHIRNVADRLAGAGYRALAPDLYRGRVAKDAAEAAAMMTALDRTAATAQDIRGAVEHLRAGGKVAALGYCMGGALTIVAAVHVPELDAAVCFYGIPEERVADPRKIRVPLLAHFANDDDWCTPDAVAALERKLEEGAVAHELYRYEAKHAFFNDDRPEVHDPKNAAAAWARTLSFLKRTIG